MSDYQWIRVTACHNVPLKEGRAVTIGDREIAIFNLGDRFVATQSHCPHKSGPLCDGIVSGTAVVCPLHAWKVDLVSGEVARPAATGKCVDTYPTRIDDGVIVVRMPAAARQGHAA